MIKEFIPFYRSNQILVLMGDDFAYENAEDNYSQLDLLIAYFNSKYKDKNIRLIYSTPNIYIDALDES
jgi:hypothetical protein